MKFSKKGCSAIRTGGPGLQKACSIIRPVEPVWKEVSLYSPHQGDRLNRGLENQKRLPPVYEGTEGMSSSECGRIRLRLPYIIRVSGLNIEKE